MARAELLQYNPAYDRTEKNVQFIAKQLETHLRERFNALVSTTEYAIKNGHLVRQGTEEPFIESIKRGRDVIQKLSSNKVDANREDAEVIGFEKIDSFLSDPATPLNSKMLSVSPQGDEGSKYQHNFYDIFTLRQKNGARYVELSRYSSALTRRDYARRLGLDFNNPPKAEEFLANPIAIKDVFIAPEKIHEALHMNHEYMRPSDFAEIWTSPIVQACVKRYQLNRDARSFNTVLNAADEVWENKNRREKGQEEYRDYSVYKPSYSEIRLLEEKKVRQAGGQCPGKSGADINNSPFSVSEFADLAPDKYGERSFECPECGKTNIRPKDEFLKNCQHCGSSKVAC
jgi:predicted RNA-binding Zn-ribbon protein involved in translation (DUF1610 family)